MAQRRSQRNTDNHKRLPTTAAESELGLLGSFFIGAHDLVSKVEEFFFADERNRIVFRTMRSLAEADRPFDPATLSDELKSLGLLDAAGGLAYLAELLDAVPSAELAPHYLRTIQDAWERRRPLQIVEEISTALQRGEIRADQVEHRLTGELELLQHVRNASKVSRLISCADLEQIPKPEFLIEEIMPARSLSVLFGAPGAGKTFLALDWALCVATSHRWMERTVIGGRVVYVATEGSAGLGARVRAWKQSREYRGSAARLHFVTSPVALIDRTDVEALITDVARLDDPPLLFVFDTLSRSMPGADENSQGDMSTMVQNVDRIRDATGAAVLLLHHANAGGERERGSTVLRGAADTMLQLKAEDDRIELRCEKMKDSAAFNRVVLHLERTGESAVFTPNPTLGVTSGNLSSIERDMLEALTSGFLDDGATVSEWCKVAGKPNGPFYRARTSLVEKGLVDPGEGGRGSRYTVTAAGREALYSQTPNSLPSHSQERDVSLPPTPGGSKPRREGSNGDHDTDYDLWEQERAAGGAK